ncbi:hypothetical protein MuYL_3272 [Mucilaginibacter xinganensis]|uniref:Uncharacterized protein n=1 Tax=Mucilaginibacter xinganensis TaxID=1234841 RepID=A0A223NZ52_9SPHI|nr:hypothetical protein MuYL_3272 [Mucilaginibacter xinganensis]
MIYKYKLRILLLRRKVIKNVNLMEFNKTFLEAGEGWLYNF